MRSAENLVFGLNVNNGMAAKTIFLAFVVSFVLLSTNANAQNQALDINKIKSASNTAIANGRRTNASREKAFNAEKGRQQGRLNAMKNERARQERLSDQLDKQYEVNEKSIEDLQTELAKELGDLKELFGVIQQTASEAQEDYKTSLISTHFPERSENLRLM
ncbi:MAG: hypothetical protein HKN85_04480, partial [Gammaproteobacteria bacterium]|nr:hypothetical protein [Gammaproteobacteria bacterium]